MSGIPQTTQQFGGKARAREKRGLLSHITEPSPGHLRRTDASLYTLISTSTRRMLLIAGHQGIVGAAVNIGVAGEEGLLRLIGLSSPGEACVAWAHSFQGTRFSFALKKGQSRVWGRMGFWEVNPILGTPREQNQKAQLHRVGSPGICTLYGPGMFWKHLQRRQEKRGAGARATPSSAAKGRARWPDSALCSPSDAPGWAQSLSFAYYWQLILLSMFSFLPPHWVLKFS